MNKAGKFLRYAWALQVLLHREMESVTEIKYFDL